VHENIVPLLGVAPLNETPSEIMMFPGIVLPYFKNGDARTYAFENPSVNLTSILIDILNGLIYIHSKGIVHGELRAVCHHILMYSMVVAKIHPVQCLH
jgi:serine/threonine protein kinase